ncbi:TonB-dependent receptor [Sphingomonas bacterium]|uniref:TonB-dependent receptor n=1 Tax=Sphingomonas bacterium TaxID=1895847 RepID=UPI001575F2AC|nr:TonB-dependent receptor [Sphingomonas bacterium]
MRITIVARHRAVHFLSALLASAALPLTAGAQTQPDGVQQAATQVTDTTAPPAQAGPLATEPDTADRLEDVTVVARKRAESAQAVPIPITVISLQELVRQNLVNFTDFQTKLPAFSVYLTNPKQLNLGVRGIGNNGFNTDGIDGSVGVFVDGVYEGRQGIVSSDFNDVAQVELLRGPQGTLFGKNTTAGAVIISTQKPSFTPEIFAEGTAGNEAYRQLKVNVSGPVLGDTVALRVSGYYSAKNGNYPNLQNALEQNAREAKGLRIQALVQPASNLSIRLIAAHGDQDFPTLTPVTLSVYLPTALQARMTAAGYPLLVSNVRDRQLNINGRQNATTHFSSGSGQIDWGLGSLGELTSITAYQKWDCFTQNDNDYTQLYAIRDYGSCNTEHQFSQEVRLATPHGRPIEAVIGGFLSRQTLDVDSRIQFGSQYNIWAANPSATAFPTLAGRTWAQGAYVNAVNGFGIASHATFKTDTDAVFANVTWHPDAAQRFALDGGLRQTWEFKTDRYAGNVASNPGNLSTAQINALSPSGANAQLGNAFDHVTDSSLSGEATASYKPMTGFLVYAKYARGYKSKGFNLLPYNASNPDTGIPQAITLGARQDIDGETADNVEAGFKTEFFDRRLIFNVTAFSTLVRNYQANEAIGVGNTATRFLANVGALRSKGVEVEGEAQPLPGLHLKGFVAFDHAYYARFHNSVCPGEFTALSCDLTGRTVAWAPRWTMDGTADYTREIAPDVAAYVIGDVNWRSSQNTTITLDPLARITAYALASARVGVLLDHKRLDLQLWVTNLFDKAYYINLLGYTRSTGIVQGYPGNPRAFGGSALVHF